MKPTIVIAKPPRRPKPAADRQQHPVIVQARAPAKITRKAERMDWSAYQTRFLEQTPKRLNRVLRRRGVV